ncbi:MAG TPA: hypothetical protein EYP67_01455, partial [Methanosarcinales archaeon]|nr:hypothetical protein [Methanosarcinales archaeon]
MSIKMNNGRVLSALLTATILISTITGTASADGGVCSTESNPEAGSSGYPLISNIDDILADGKPVFLFFYTDWCHFCHQQMPIVDELEEEYAEKLAFIRINAGERPDYAEEFGVGVLPTIFVISGKNGREYVKEEITGFTEETGLKEIIALEENTNQMTVVPETQGMVTSPADPPGDDRSHSNITITPMADIVTLDFDSYADKTRIDEQYAGQGVHFLNDYKAGQIYRASPQITAHPNARTSPNVLVNDFYDIEFGSSVDVPMVIWFEKPVTGVGMWLGTTESWCTPQATVSIYDCRGSLLGEKTVTVSSAFNTPLEVDDPLERVQQVVIDYGDTTCPEAIDEFAFRFGAGQCTDTTPPRVTITSHPKSSVENTPGQTIKGTVVESGILKSVKINGVPAEFYMSFGVYYFSGKVTLKDGSNTITVLAEDGSGLKHSDQVTITLGVPSSASLGQFHLTQRGIMQNKACDVDGPLVAGKDAIARIFLDVKTASGMDTYVSSVEMKLWRREQGVDKLVDTFWGTIYSPFLSGFNSPNHMTAIHFWIQGDKLDSAGEYRFEFQPYVGLSKVGSPLVANCGGEYFTFTETKPIRLFIMPVEAGISNPHHTENHLRDYFKQIHTIARTFPVRDGYSEPWHGKKTGVYYVEGSPLRLCDGTEAMKNKYGWCSGTGWRWRLIDRDPSGVLRRADHEKVYDYTIKDQICDPKQPTIGGRVLNNGVVGTDAAHTIDFVPGLGIFRGGAHPQWGEKKHYVPIDEDHDGQIDRDDYQHFISEFFDEDDSTTPRWTTDLNKYDHGETYRHFVDQNGNHCNDRKSGKLLEPNADVVHLWYNANKIAFGPASEAMNAYNKA